MLKLSYMGDLKYVNLKTVTVLQWLPATLAYCFFRAPNTVQDTTALEQDCLGDYGGPVFPYVALGGYEVW